MEIVWIHYGFSGAIENFIMDFTFFSPVLFIVITTLLKLPSLL
jgi:hypothetical protein